MHDPDQTKLSGGSKPREGQARASWSNIVASLLAVGAAFPVINQIKDLIELSHMLRILIERWSYYTVLFWETVAGLINIRLPDGMHPVLSFFAFTGSLIGVSIYRFRHLRAAQPSSIAFIHSFVSAAIAGTLGAQALAKASIPPKLLVALFFVPPVTFPLISRHGGRDRLFYSGFFILIFVFMFAMPLSKTAAMLEEDRQLQGESVDDVWANSFACQDYSLPESKDECDRNQPEWPERVDTRIAWAVGLTAVFALFFGAPLIAPVVLLNEKLFVVLIVSVGLLLLNELSRAILPEPEEIYIRPRIEFRR